MKALSVHQPWADMIAAGEKWIEYRSWSTRYRGDLVICASKAGPPEYAELGGKEVALPKGVMLCVVKLIDCVPTTREDEDHPGHPGVDGYYGWVLDDYIDILVPKPVKGRLGLYSIPEEEIELAPEGKFWFHYL